MLVDFLLLRGNQEEKQYGIDDIYRDKIGVSDVIFGEEGDSLLLGAFTLEALGLALDPIKRELRELPMII